MCYIIKCPWGPFRLMSAFIEFWCTHKHTQQPPSPPPQQQQILIIIYLWCICIDSSSFSIPHNPRVRCVCVCVCTFVIILIAAVAWENFIFGRIIVNRYRYFCSVLFFILFFVQFLNTALDLYCLYFCFCWSCVLYDSFLFYYEFKRKKSASYWFYGSLAFAVILLLFWCSWSSVCMALLCHRVTQFVCCVRCDAVYICRSSSSLYIYYHNTWHIQKL